MSSLSRAIREYQLAFNARYRIGEVGWIEEHQKREKRYLDAVNRLLHAALDAGSEDDDAEN